MTEYNIDAIETVTPDIEQYRRAYAQLHESFDAAVDAEGRNLGVQSWDDLRRRTDTWQSLVQLRFEQDTRNSDYKAAREFRDEITPQLTDLDVAFMRKLLASPHRGELEQHWGSQAFSLWESFVATFEPTIQADLVKESKLEAEYTELLASAEIPFRGETFNLPQLDKFFDDPDRDTRRDSEQARWTWYNANGEQLDRIFADLVQLRTGMARALGFDNFVGMAYQRMARIDYGEPDVDRFRQEVRRHVTPLGVELRRQQGQNLGVDPLMYWDEGVLDPLGNPRPQGDHDWMLGRAQSMFDQLHPSLGDFFGMLVRCRLLDLKARDGKAGGGFCTSFPSVGQPFIFANFNGSKGDVEVFTHEVGHAFQNYLSRDLKLNDYVWPTFESCEIHSMGLEFLTWPFMEEFFGADAERFRRVHLLQGLLFLAYGVAVDHFQHLVYAEPNASPQRRHEMWREMEATYLPWRNYGDLPHVSQGGFWQRQRHIYLSPFYYIDYTLAQTCALQFWVRSREDYDSAVKDYVALCRRGGELPFGELVASAQLVSPFESGCLEKVVGQARAFLRA